VAATADAAVAEQASEASIAAAAVAKRAVAALHATVEEHKEELGRLDAVAGDGDHGIGMQRGSAAAVDAAVAAASRGAGAGTVLLKAGDAWADRAGGTSGALWGVILRSIGEELGDESAPDAASVAAGVTSGARAVVDVGKAELGDKTMVDVLLPFADALTAGVQSGKGLRAAWRDAAEQAKVAAAATADLLPKRGRARPHAEKSLGTPDAGAHSLALITLAIAGVLETSN
jgi:dihydroxyacetone kinase